MARCRVGKYQLPQASPIELAVGREHPAAKLLCKEACAVDFVRDAFGHLKAIAADAGALVLLKKADIKPGGGVFDITQPKEFIAAAKTRQWEREKSVRTLA